MIDRLAAAWRETQVMQSPLLADIGPDDRRFWWTLLAAICGVAAGVLAVLVVVIVLGISGAVLYASQGGDPDHLGALMNRLMDPTASLNLGMTLGIIGMLAVINGMMALIAVIVASLVIKKPLKASFTAAPRFRLRQLVAGLVLYALVLAPVLIVQTLTGEVDAEMPLTRLAESPAQILLFLLVAVVGLIVAAGAEELVFRGWLLRHTAAFTRNPWILLLINGVLFSAIHMDPDLNSFITRAVMGVVFCYMALRFGGIEFAIGAHAANNILIVLFIEPMNLQVPPPEPFQAHYLVESAVLLIIGVAVTELVFRVPALRRWTRADATTAATRVSLFS